jgi:glycosyltransferase involved in cell wall biosynthesis
MPAPVALFAFRRPEHLRSTLVALARNALAAQSNLYIFCDGPRNTSDEPLVLEVQAVADSCTGFASVNVIKRPSNFGLARSILSGVDYLFERFDRLIVLEDDLVTAPQFLQYMNTALEHYAGDPAVFSITGFSYPSAYFKLPANYPFDTFAAYRCCSNSWGTWRDRWQRIDWSMGYFQEFSKSSESKARFNLGGQDLADMLELQYNGHIDSWAIRFCYAHFQRAMHCIYPTQSMVRNIGLDHSGTHSAPNPKFHHESLYAQWQPIQFCPGNSIDPTIAEEFRRLFAPPEATIVSRLKEWVQRHIANISKISGAVLSLIRRVLVRPLRRPDVLVVNTYQGYGGAARAAYRIFDGVRLQRPRTHLLTLFRGDADPDIFGLEPTTVRGACAKHLLHRDTTHLWAYPQRQNTYFSPAIHANPFRIKFARFRPGLVHLHWIGHSLLSIEELGNIRSPVIWTLHDAWPFTGGCHTPGACDHYMQQCGNCPQLGSGSDNDLSRHVFLRKLRAYQNLDLTIVTPSKWLAEKSSQSSLFGSRTVKVIPNGIDTQKFKPIGKTEARDYFDLPAEVPVFIFVAHLLTDPNKGADLLFSVLAGFERPCILLTVGSGTTAHRGAPNVTLRELGPLEDDSSLALAYSAADVLLCTSRQENLPNTIAEAMACGTPCAGFRIGGLPDMIAHQVNGWLAEPFDTSGLASGIAWLVQHSDVASLRKAAREKALQDFDIRKTTAAYLQLYDETQNRNRAPNL